MIVGSTGFSFGGVHSRDDMGLIYAEKDGHVMITEIKRNAYSIAGMSGTVLMPGEAWQMFFLEGTLYPAEEPRTLSDAQALLRDIVAWLTAGRQRLIFDYEPEVYYLAEIATAAKYSLRNWFGGELPIRFTVQPFAYNVDVNAATVETTGTSVTVSVSVETGQPAPLKLTVENTGGAAITRVACGGVILDGMNLGAGKTLVIDTEPPAGATIGNTAARLQSSIGAVPSAQSADNFADGEVTSAMQYATKFSPTWCYNGSNQFTVGLSYSGSGTRRAKVSALARGRW